MDLLDLEIQQGKLPSNYLAQLKGINSQNTSKVAKLEETFNNIIQSIFESPTQELFRSGMKLLMDYSELDGYEFKEYEIAHYNDDYSEYASIFANLKDYVFSKDGVRAITYGYWEDSIAFTYRRSLGVLEVHLPSGNKDLGIIHLSAETKAKLNNLITNASAMSSGKTFFTDGSGKLIVGE